ncbi:sugar transporter [Mycobacteroides abscessus subsp. abscessus]|nr:sugar transporter [Mycobacteroides abscessus subsp. abscessus]
MTHRGGYHPGAYRVDAGSPRAPLSLLFVARWVEETKGRALEDMDSAIS